MHNIIQVELYYNSLISCGGCGLVTEIGGGEVVGGGDIVLLITVVWWALIGACEDKVYKEERPTSIILQSENQV